MHLLKEITFLLQKELVLEWRYKYALQGILLYTGSTIFICYLSFGLNTNLSIPTWNALFWIIILFTSFNAIAKSFMLERQERNNYYYSIVSPGAIILSKTIYNMLLMCFISMVAALFYTTILGNIVNDLLLFLLNILLGASSLAAILTMISAIAAKATGAGTLMAVLSIPAIVPTILLSIKVSKNAIDGLDRTVSYDEILVLIAINIIVTAVSYLLFPYIWKS